ncbi:MAG TPA: hypothetical protein VNV15_07935 [Opitutaceae bacterium]|jgi:Tfp pilus assembly protein PilO|nr:hypothetical protein [Opitutaceae bacterium]
MNAIALPNFIKKQPVAVVCALFCVALAVAIYFRKDTLATAQAELDDKTSRANHLKENVDSATSVNKADRLDEQLATMTQATQAIEARLVHVDQLAVNKQYFYKIESETQTKLTSLNQTGVMAAGKNSGNTAYVAVVYSVNVEGTYAQLLDFMRRVENGDHFSRVQGLTLSQAGGGDNTPGHASLGLQLQLLGLP